MPHRKAKSTPASSKTARPAQPGGTDVTAGPLRPASKTQSFTTSHITRINAFVSAQGRRNQAKRDSR